MDVYTQSETSECGLACLAMIASHHGDRSGLRALRARFAVSQQGASLKRLIEIAASMGLRARALRLDLPDVGKLALPCILHWGLNHYVVLTKVGSRHLQVIDPASGPVTVPWADFSRMFTGIALELAPEASLQPVEKPPSLSLRQLGGDVHGLRRSLALVIALSLALQAFVLLAPFQMQWVVDHVLVSADRDLLTLLGLGFLAVVLLQVGIGALRGWTVIYVSNQLGMQWLANMGSHLLRLPLAFFEKRHLGDITSRMGSIQTIQRTLTTSFVEAIIDGLMAILTLTMMLLYAWKLVLVTLLAVAAYLLMRWLSFGPVRRATEKQLIAGARQNSHLLESIRGIQSLKVSGSEPMRLATFHNLVQNTVNQDVGLSRLALLLSSASQLVFGVERVVVIWIGASLALANVFSIGMLIAYLAYKDQFSARVAGLIDKWVEFRMLGLHGERLADIALCAPESSQQEAEFPLQGASISVTGLSFRYAAGEPWVLHDCSFSIGNGESVAIVGASGCGKTTLVKVLLGLLVPEHGAVDIDGKRLEPRHHHAYRQQIAAVMQDDQLFAGSVADNIGLGDDTPDMPRVEAAARLAAIHDELAALPMGYQSLVGDMGAAFSGGQKQRLILARALYRKPRLLFLDEATSHLDVHCERQVNTAIRDLRLTRIIIAHRPETIASADRVLVMEGGRIVAEHRRDSTVTADRVAAEANP